MKTEFVKIIKADTEEKKKYLGAITSVLLTKEMMDDEGTALVCDKGNHPWQDDEFEKVDFKPVYSIKFDVYPNREMKVTVNDDILVAISRCPKLCTLDKFAHPMADLIEDIVEGTADADEESTGGKHYAAVRTAFGEYWKTFKAEREALLASQPVGEVQPEGNACYIVNSEGIHKMAYDSENAEIREALQKGLCFSTYEEANKKRAELLENALRNL